MKKRSGRTHTHKYKNILFLFVSIIISVYMFRNESLHTYLLHLGTLEYLGAFLAGIFWVSTFTIAPASIVLFILAENLPIWSIALFGGFGALIGDSVIFRFIRNSNISDELMDIFDQLGGRKIRHLFHLRHLRWTWPFIGALIIISPLPDEIGVSLMGLSKVKYVYFAFISFVLNTIGILLLLSASFVVKP